MCSCVGEWLAVALLHTWMWHSENKTLSAVCCGCGCGCLWRQDAARCDMRVDEVLRARASKALHGLLVLSQKSMMLKQVASRWRSDGKGTWKCVFSAVISDRGWALSAVLNSGRWRLSLMTPSLRMQEAIPP
ncbi:hypothetical protein PTSG_13188 [Salpingoeca rosetta]|uniref:Secreted protein n=1 Tax=Salpingoeca rosetta (strain ATCC 50818 / BSB-021) TaxID=946362 RepID=F2UTC6_SALR5|nr:uncharacterized protein PTSG_13188 [Salpingoeca rosetta]EGD82379.1 hypothetical protein PTSG_13188 [Salpingoeca rosetta]|eukprot:XP_004987579.1 hypothetical protein PTSG_13188 [Salpingoeca rosetta]